MPGSAYVGAYCIKSHLGCECGQNSLSTWRLTKKIMSASRSDMCAPLRQPLLQHNCLWADNLLSSPATCHPRLPTVPPSHSLRCLCLHTQSKRPETPGEPPARRLHTVYVDQRLRALGFLCYWRVPDYTQAKQMHTPHPITCLKTPPSLCPLLASYQSTSQLLRFEYEGPFEEKKASGTRLGG